MTIELRIYTATGAALYKGLTRHAFMKMRLGGMAVKPGIHLELDGFLQSYWDEEQLKMNIEKDIIYTNYLSIRGMCKYIGISLKCLQKKLMRGDAGDPDLKVYLNGSTTSSKEYRKKEEKLIELLHVPDPNTIKTHRDQRKKEEYREASIQGYIIKDIYIRGYQDAVEMCRKEMAKKYRKGHLQCPRCVGEVENNKVLPS